MPSPNQRVWNLSHGFACEALDDLDDSNAVVGMCPRAVYAILGQARSGLPEDVDIGACKDGAALVDGPRRGAATVGTAWLIAGTP